MVGIIPGGAAEALYSNPGEDYKLLVGRRKGYVRVALKHGAPILPLFSFGEIEVMEQARYEEGSWLFEVQKLLKRLTRVNFIVPKDGLRGMVPRSVPITAVCEYSGRFYATYNIQLRNDNKMDQIALNWR